LQISAQELTMVLTVVWLTAMPQFAVDEQRPSEGGIGAKS
jgi:hypothetical protein